VIWDLFRAWMWRIWRGVVWLFGAAREPRQINPIVYQIISFVLIVVIGLLLAWFTPKLPLADDLGFHWGIVNRCFWGIVWFLLYIFVRLVLYVVELFRMEEVSQFQDIDRAWITGLRELAAKGLDLHNIPLFLITGLRDVSDETAFLSGAGFHAVATGPDVEQAAPLRIFANTDAILVMISGVSTTSAQLRAVGGGSPGVAGGGAMDSAATLSPGAAASGGIGSAGAGGNSFGSNSFGGDSATIDPSKALQAHAAVVTSVQPLSQAESDRCEARLAHLSRIMTRDRDPLCPINGLIATVPLPWTRTLRSELYKSVQSDMAQLSWSLGLQFPVVCLASGVESLGELHELLSRCRAADQRFSEGIRAGARYPVGQPVSIQNARWAAGRSLAWFHQWIYACFASDCSTNGARTNGHLYRLWCNLTECRAPFATLLEAGFGSSGSVTPIRLTGCYFTGLAHRQMIFLRDVLNRLVTSQDQVAWTPERLAKDASLRAWALLVWLAVAGLVLVDAALIWDRWFR
jgi:hypothetical protein